MYMNTTTTTTTNIFLFLIYWPPFLLGWKSKFHMLYLPVMEVHSNFEGAGWQ